MDLAHVCCDALDAWGILCFQEEIQELKLCGTKIKEDAVILRKAYLSEIVEIEIDASDEMETLKPIETKMKISDQVEIDVLDDIEIAENEEESKASMKFDRLMIEAEREMDEYDSKKMKK